MPGNRAHPGHPPLSQLFENYEKDSGKQPNRAAVAHSLRNLADRHRLSVTDQEIDKMAEVIIQNPREVMTTAPAKETSHPAAPVDTVDSHPHTLGHKLSTFWRCYKRQIMWIVLFYLFQIFAFGMGVYHYVYVMLANPQLKFSVGSLIGMGFGMVLQVNCGILMLGPALRWIMGSLRKTWLSRFFPFDSAITFHIIIASTTCVAIAGHITAMIISFYQSAVHDPIWRHFNITLTAVLTKSGLAGSDFLGFTAISGWIALSCIAVMTFFALPPIRRSCAYDLFYWTHKLQFVVWAALIVHAPDFWKVFIIPFCLYLIEKSRKYINAVRWSRTSHITEVKLFPAEVTNLVIKRPNGFNYMPGDYCFLKIPSLGIFSWHPFTVSSSPDQIESITFHIKASGNYTKSLRSKFEKRLDFTTTNKDTNPSNVIVIDPTNRAAGSEIALTINNGKGFLTNLDVPVFVDGPYGSTSRELFRSEHAVLICAGIGVTPFASVLSSLLSEFKRNNHSKCPNCEHEFPTITPSIPMRIDGRRLKLRKIEFIWVIREIESMEWFHDLFHAWEMQQSGFGKTSSVFLNCHIYVTTGKQNAHTSSRWTIGSDNLTMSVRPGRPNWPKVFTDLDAQKRGKVNVFYCGTHALEDQIRNLCGQHKFGFSWENF
ncbi:NADPH oxidase 5-like [Paramacrobiotus metropolitanus]|uniref:NADPH oxidase 5-like n=1 Tax=Paramacrobiotus metropolitanus TaxID=2943436 RepID=UPI002445E04D|nr:NADPH oxidase 5-like [Paramacrobiotus metropolitanus]